RVRGLAHAVEIDVTPAHADVRLRRLRAEIDRLLVEGERGARALPDAVPVGALHQRVVVEGAGALAVVVGLVARLRVLLVGLRGACGRVALLRALRGRGEELQDERGPR